MFNKYLDIRYLEERIQMLKKVFIHQKLLFFLTSDYSWRQWKKTKKNLDKLKIWQSQYALTGRSFRIALRAVELKKKKNKEED